PRCPVQPTTTRRLGTGDSPAAGVGGRGRWVGAGTGTASRGGGPGRSVVVGGAVVVRRGSGSGIGSVATPRGVGVRRRTPRPPRRFACGRARAPRTVLRRLVGGAGADERHRGGAGRPQLARSIASTLRWGPGVPANRSAAGRAGGAAARRQRRTAAATAVLHRA